MNKQLVDALKVLLKEAVKANNPDTTHLEAMVLKDVATVDNITQLHNAFKLLLKVETTRSEFEKMTIFNLLQLIEKI